MEKAPPSKRPRHDAAFRIEALRLASVKPLDAGRRPGA